ncbi:NAD(P)-dependent dehydrogenase (short-subunit alcohol dehydrogenase family) [Thiogranum longum]|uniref:NAD(P)-dependent dehydrogenase (Short-subunit alcohol dehydrogenase family) n=1 Tax=Thiogranum longum TaxID=1537524 RepID=A0A4R1H8S8_9GAMM|nr:SDR family oxidoreductase [Thiogranum longum]TCK18244.1 NAD(P)-dependent dehydrogenase (short-subunit alcohol dehydrogenase family) [Thiogranum longum]
MTETILITGSNRGIGLELVHQYAAQGWRVLACCRQPDQATALDRLVEQFPDVSVYALDVAQQDQILKLARDLQEHPIDILFNNAGIYGPSDAVFGNTDEAKWLECLRINVIAPMKMMEAFLPHVAASKHKLIAAMSSKMGSMADNGSGGSYIYRSSKAALNAVMKSAAIDLAPRGVKVAILHPGWVKTDMGGPNAEITVAESVGRMREILGTVTPKNSGTFFDIDGSIIPW